MNSAILWDADEPFYPTQISGLLLYWDFGDAANLAVNNDGSGGPPADGGNIKYGFDLSGLGNHVKQHAAHPSPTWIANSLKGKGTALFPGTGVMDSLGNLTLPANEITIVGIAKRVGAGGSLSPLFTAGVDSYSVAGSNWFQLRCVEGGNWMFDGSGANLDATSAVAYDGIYRLATCIRTVAGTSNIYINGVLSGTSTAAYTLATPKPAFLGGWNDVNTVNANVACVLVYNRALTAAEQLKLEVFLADRFGIYHPGATWPRTKSIFTQASILDNLLNVDQIGGATDTLKYLFDGNNIDGLGNGNATLTDHGLLATWKNQGTTGAAGDAAQSTDKLKPTVEKDIESNTNDGVAFGGNNDYLSIGGSAVGLSFIEDAGIFDIVIVGRRDIEDAAVLLSNMSGLDKGFNLLFTAANKVELDILNGVSTILTLTGTQNFPLGGAFMLEAKGSGTVGYVSADLAAFDSGAMGALATGDATNAAYIGRHVLNANQSYDGALFGIGIYTAQLSAGARALLKAGLQGRFNV